MRLRPRAISLIALVVAASPLPARPQQSAAPVAVVAVGTRLDVRLQTGLNSGVTKPDQRFETITIDDVRSGDALAIPAGSIARGFVSSVRASNASDHKAVLTLSFDEIRRQGAVSSLRASVVEAIDGRLGPVGAAASLLAPGRPPLIGVIVTDDGSISSSAGANVDLPVGTILRIRIDKPLI